MSIGCLNIPKLILHAYCLCSRYHGHGTPSSRQLFNASDEEHGLKDKIKKDITDEALCKKYAQLTDTDKSCLSAAVRGKSIFIIRITKAWK